MLFKEKGWRGEKILGNNVKVLWIVNEMFFSERNYI
jgi:hypothetical protein